MFTIDLGEVSNNTGVNRVDQVSLFGEDQINEYIYSHAISVGITSNIYDSDQNNYIDITNWKTFTDSLIFYKNTILGSCEPEFLSDQIRLWFITTKFKSELPDGNDGPHFIPYDSVWTKLDLQLDPGEDPTSWTFGKARLAYKSNNIQSDYCEPPFTYVYMIPVMKQHTEKPYVLQLLIIKVSAEYNEDGTYSFQAHSQFEKILETDQILSDTPIITFAVMNRFDDVDEYVYGICGVDSKILESAFWCLDAQSFKYNITNQEFTLGSNIYSRSGWGSVHNTTTNDTTKYFYIPDIKEFRPHVSDSSYACTLVVDTLELIDQDDTGWGDRDRELYKLSKYRYYVDDVWYTGENYYQYLGTPTGSALNWESQTDVIYEFGKIPGRWDRTNQQSTYYPYKDTYYGYDGIPEVGELTRIDIIGYENIPQSNDYVYFTKVFGVPYLAILKNPDCTVQSEWIPYSGILMSQIQHTHNTGSSIYGGFSLSKQCRNITNAMNEFTMLVSMNKNNKSTWYKIQSHIEGFYPRPNTSGYFSPYLVRDCKLLDV